MKRTSFIREYRTLLEKLIDGKIRIKESVDFSEDEKQRHIAKIDTLIDKLLVYFNYSIDYSLDVIKRNAEEKE